MRACSVQAQAIDARVAAGETLGPLAGVPVAIKDNICTAGMETTAGSYILKGYVPTYDATAVARLRAAGAIIIGKTNCDEFGMGSSTENSAYKATKNAVSAEHVPGASCLDLS
jgi:aspartyl-tRNA(Asn)/glutamyl-tRNA(Gln) amidotransferase subunit A